MLTRHIISKKQADRGIKLSYKSLANLEHQPVFEECTTKTGFPGSEEMPSKNDHQITCYENAIPSFVAEAMDRCYSALCSSVPYLQLFGELSSSTCTYVAFSTGLISSVFLYEQRKSVIEVLNGRMRTEPEELSRFADHIFNKMAKVTSIRFPAVSVQKLQVAYPSQQFLNGEDIVISPAETEQPYERQIGKSTRKNIKKRAAALKRMHPTSCFKIIKGDSIDTELVDRIVRWNRERMKKRGMVSTYKAADARNIQALAANNGMVGLIAVGDRMCAAVVCCRVGCSYHMLLTGFDGDYEEFSPGMLCCYWTAMECLRLKGREINLMWGRLPYKFDLLGQPRKYESVIIYRNRTALLCNLKNALRMAVGGYMQKVKYSLLDCERRDDGVARLVKRAIATWRVAKKNRCMNNPGDAV